MFGNRWKRLHLFGKSSFLDLEPSTMIHADFVSFLTSTEDRIKNLAFPGQIKKKKKKSIGELSMVYKK